MYCEHKPVSRWQSFGFEAPSRHQIERHMDFCVAIEGLIRAYLLKHFQYMAAIFEARAINDS